MNWTHFANAVTQILCVGAALTSWWHGWYWSMALWLVLAAAPAQAVQRVKEWRQS